MLDIHWAWMICERGGVDLTSDLRSGVRPSRDHTHPIGPCVSAVAGMHFSLPPALWHLTLRHRPKNITVVVLLNTQFYGGDGTLRISTVLRLFCKKNI